MPDPDELSGARARDMVRAGYDAIAETYLRVRRDDTADIGLLDELAAQLPPSAKVLDAGCGSGVPVARELSERLDFEVVGVDFSAAQVALARTLVPDVTFLQQDLTQLDLPAASFDAICCFYAIIHVPREEHPEVLHRFHDVLRPRGLLLLSTGATASDGDTEDDWLSGGAPMYWSHHGHEENLQLIRDAGFAIVWDRLINEPEEFGGGTHLFVLARKNSTDSD